MSVIDTYLAEVAKPQRAELERVRAIIKQAAPEAEEVITYGMPGFKYQKKYLIAFAPFKDHMSVFPGSAAAASIQEALKDYKQSKGTIQFTPEKPLPEAVIRELVAIRVNEINKA